MRVSLVAAADWVDAARDDLNRINVFPVPDGDTGTNFASTLRAVANAVSQVAEPSLPKVARAMAEASVLGARGNSGMLLSQFLLGFQTAIGTRDRAHLEDVAAAMRAGADQMTAALEHPVEGTILTVSRAAAEAAAAASRVTQRFDDFMRRVHAAAEEAVRRTPELLALLREAGVVDAGGQAFARAIEGVVRWLSGQPVRHQQPAAVTRPHAAATAVVNPERDFRFCTQVLVRGAGLPSAPVVRAALRPHGGSIVVLAVNDLLKIHVHTDAPEAVLALARRWGEVEDSRAEDVREQHRRLTTKPRTLAVVVDSSADLSDNLVDRHGILVVPLQVIIDDQVYLDRLDLSSAELYRRMRTGAGRFTTSQPTPAAFAEAFRDALAQADQVLALMLSGPLSGTHAAAVTAAKATEPDRITVLDSHTASLGLGMLAVRAAELAKAGKSVAEITQDLRQVRARSGGLFTIDTFDYVVRSGRIGRARAWLGQMLDLKPILELDQAGVVAPVSRVRGRDQLIPRILALLDRRLSPRPRRVRFGVAHADVPETAQTLASELHRRFQSACLLAPVTAALGVHVGPGAWGVFYQVEEPAPE